MKTHMQDIADFHNRFGLTYEGKPRALPKKLADFRIDFIREEHREYITASHQLGLLTSGDSPLDEAEITHQLEEQFDALIDMVYVILGAAYLHGYEKRWQEGWDRVHYANMQKIRADSENTSKRDGEFDVVKPKGWRPPSHTDLVEDHAHK